VPPEANFVQSLDWRNEKSTFVVHIPKAPTMGSAAFKVAMLKDPLAAAVLLYSHKQRGKL
jgi:hypothetical protein